MQEVNIYVQTSARGPSIRKKAYYSYVIECGTATRTSEGVLEDITENQIELTVLIKAFQRLTKPCSVRVFTRCEHILNSMNNHWPYQWQKNGWVKSAGKPVKNAELWQQLLNVMEQHYVAFIGDPHEYSNWQQSELKKLEETDNGKKV